MEINEIKKEKDYDKYDKESKIEKDKIFNRLKKIQLLLRKESALNDLCKKI